MTDHQDPRAAIRSAIDAAQPVTDDDPFPDGGSPLDETDGPATPPTVPPERAADVEFCAGLDHSDTDNGIRLRKHFGRDLAVLALDGVRNGDYTVWTGTHWDMRTGPDAALKRAQELGALIMAEAGYLKHTPEEAKLLEALASFQRGDGIPSDLGLDAKQLADEAAKAVEALAKRKAKRRAFGVSSKNKARLDAMLACAAPHLTRPMDGWNPDPLRFACRTHTVEFRKRPAADDPSRLETERVAIPGHQREHWITRVLPVDYDPEAECTRWRAFLKEFLPDDSVRRLVQVFCGLALTGIPIQKLLFHYGLGANGKSVFLEVLVRVLGDLAVTLASETVSGTQERNAQGASPDLARTHTKWFIRVPEMPPNQPVREELVKKLTGGEAIPVRNLFKGTFEFVPVGKSHWSGNGYPQIDGTDLGIWRRIAVVHWSVTIPPERRRDFNEVVNEFVAEAPGILNWLIDGALIYFDEGLVEPDAVKIATKEYRDEMDPIGMFVAACVVHRPGFRITAREMYQAYQAWAAANGMKPFSETKFGRVMKTKLPRDDGSIRTYPDVDLHDVPRNPADGDRWSDPDDGGGGGL